MVTNILDEYGKEAETDLANKENDETVELCAEKCADKLFWKVCEVLEDIAVITREGRKIDLNKERQRIFGLVKKMTEENNSLLSIVVLLATKLSEENTFEMKRLCADCIIDLKILLSKSVFAKRTSYSEMEMSDIVNWVEKLYNETNKLILVIKSTMIKLLLRDVFPDNNLFVSVEETIFAEDDSGVDYLYKVLKSDKRLSCFSVCDFRGNTVYIIYWECTSNDSIQIVIFDERAVSETEANQLSFQKNGKVYYLFLEGNVELNYTR